MNLASDTLNAFLEASGSRRTFSFGKTVFYNDCTFEDLMYAKWPTPQVVAGLEARLLWRLLTAYKAISLFVNYAEYGLARSTSRVPSPAFSNSTAFAADVLEILDPRSNAPPAPTTLVKEDENWAHQLTEEIRTRISLSEPEEADDELTDKNGDPRPSLVAHSHLKVQELTLAVSPLPP
jgi:hypothetical protein